jgi:hypothetical protein
MILTMTSPSRPTEQGHWYDAQGNPRYTIVGKNGKERNTTLRDAREHGFLPSVTSIIRQAAAPGLEMWKQKQVLLAALTLPRIDGEPEDTYLDRIIRDSQEQGRKAAEKGTQIHAAIQGHYEGQSVSAEMWPFVKGAKEKLIEAFGKQPWVCEKSFAHELGYGGKVDLHAQTSGSYYVGDIKTKEFDAVDDKKLAWDDHAIQLAAYSNGLGYYYDAYHFNLFVSTTVPGLCHIHIWSEEEIQRGWKMFRSLLSYWQAKNKIEETV